MKFLYLRCVCNIIWINSSFFAIIFVNKIHSKTRCSSYSASVRRKPTTRSFIPPAHFSTPVQFQRTDTYAHAGIRQNVAVAARYSSDLNLASNCDVNLFEGDESPPGLSRDSWRRRRSWRTDKYSLRATVDLLPGLLLAMSYPLRHPLTIPDRQPRLSQLLPSSLVMPRRAIRGASPRPTTRLPFYWRK